MPSTTGSKNTVMHEELKCCRGRQSMRKGPLTETRKASNDALEVQGELEKDARRGRRVGTDDGRIEMEVR